MFNSNQLDLLMNIVDSVERGIRNKGDGFKIQNVKAYIHKYKNNKSLNRILAEIEDVEDEYLDRMRDIRDRIMEEINL